MASRTLLVIVLLAVLGSLSHVRFYWMERAVQSIDHLDNVHARSHVQVYFDLARAYLAEGRRDLAIDTITKGLKLDAWSFDEQFLLADLEARAGRRDDAVERLTFVVEACRDERLVGRARTALESLRAAGGLSPAAVRPALPSRVLSILAFEGTDEKLVRAVAGAVSREYGVKTRLLPERPAPSRLRTRPGPRGLQFDADVLLAQVAELQRSRPRDPAEVGVVGVTSVDLTADGLNFLFGQANLHRRVGVMSYARFSWPGDAPELLMQRAVKQAFSTTGFVLGIDRCTTPTCARSYPHSLAEHDRKGDRLCRKCLTALEASYQRL